ncbi:MAG: hypothetical protein PHE17_21535 [Thiothrix sp.]|uniref:hypothetical protein n=1 Tax=Thiothrix sp. TaxID=1032 RepID=UPI002612A3F4|nr:hypothetical protein [Thiothrix sp.]MDD5395612.1 hypothetical protein [Thiothrix sp.]
MAKFPKIIQVEANRMAEGSIFVNVVAEVSNSATTALDETHNVSDSGDRLLVVMHQKAVPQHPGTVSTQVVGKKKLQFKVWGNEMDISRLVYVDVYGGDYDQANSKRAVLAY